MTRNWKRIGTIAMVLALSALMVFAGAAFAQGKGPGGNGSGVQAAPASGQANQYGSGSGMQGTPAQSQANQYGSGSGVQGDPVYGQANQYGNGSGGTGPGYGIAARGAWGGPESSLVAVAAQVLGMDQADLVAELQTGLTIADVATANSVDLQDIVDAYLAPRADTLAQAVEAGRITQDQADAMLAEMAAEISANLQEPWEAQGYGSCSGNCTGTGTPGQGAGSGANWADADGDGTCDNYGGGGMHMGTGRMGGARGGRWSS